MNANAEGLGERLKAEARSFGILFVYLAILFGTFTTYRRVLMAEYGISYLHYGISLFEAFLLAKVVLLGRMFGLGERYRDHPLIIPTLYKTFCFGILVLVFTLAEHFVSGILFGKAHSLAATESLQSAVWEGLARMLILVAGFIPLFAAWEVVRFFDAGELSRLFFKRRQLADELRGPSKLLRVHYDTVNHLAK